MEKQKNLIIVNGTMGVGKTTVCRELQKILPNCVFLDGDWCWDMVPFVVSDGTKAMVMDNITHMLNNFLVCDEFDNVLFCWVMHEQEILDEVLSKMNTDKFRLFKFSLTCSEEKLRERIMGDVEQGIREEDVIERSVPRLENYEHMDTLKIRVDSVTPEQAAKQIYDVVYRE